MKTAWFEFTSWRGIGIDRTLFGDVLRLGWIGIGVSSRNLSDWVKAWHEALRNAKGGKK